MPVSATRKRTKGPSPRLGMGFDESGVNVHGFDADGQPAAARHGVAGVDGQVHHHLFDHAAVALNECVLPSPAGIPA